MKREILMDRENENGSHTRVEKLTQTPEDGFVNNKEFGVGRPVIDRVGMFGHGHFKGRRTKVTYWTDDPRIVRPLFYLSFLVVTLLFVGFF